MNEDGKNTDLPEPTEPPIQAVPEPQVKPDAADLEKQESLENEHEPSVDESWEEEGEEDRPGLHLTRSHLSSHDIHHVQTNQSDKDLYDKFPHHRKLIIVTILSFASFLAPMSSTTVLAAVPEVAATYQTTGTIINISNAIYQLFMGFSPMFWGPLGQVYGRWPTQFYSAVLFTAFSIGTALAPNLAAFFIFRLLTAFQGTSFLIIGASCIGDIYRPTERATALSWFLSGTLVGPAFGPFLGGVIVTYRPWRDIFWLQTGLAAAATIAVGFLLPETIHYKRSVELEGFTRRQKAAKLWAWMNPSRVIRLYRYPNLLIAGLSASALVWNMYSLLTPIRYVLNPRFHLSSPIQSGLFYIAPGCGYLLGTFFGGKWADHTVKKWIKKRDGKRIPEDRLKSCLIPLGVVIPGCMLVYGWCIQEAKGGIPVPVIAMFIQGVAQLFCFPSLNTYCLDVFQKRSSEVVAGNYVFRYMLGCIGTAVCLPAIDSMGVGGFSTISAGLLVAAAGGVWSITIWGEGWRQNVDRKKAEKKERKNARYNVDLQQETAQERTEEEEEKTEDTAAAFHAVGEKTSRTAQHPPKTSSEVTKIE